MLLLSIDPSIVTTGVAILDNYKYRESYTFRTKPTDTLQARIDQIYFHFKHIDGLYDRVIIEYPDPFVRTGNHGIKNFVSLQALHVAIGVIYSALCFRYHGKIYFIKPSKWKGKGKKAQTQQLAYYHAKKKLNSHEADAVMMGLHFASEHRLRQKIDRNNY